MPPTFKKAECHLQMATTSKHKGFIMNWFPGNIHLSRLLCTEQRTCFTGKLLQISCRAGQGYGEMSFNINPSASIVQFNSASPWRSSSVPCDAGMDLHGADLSSCSVFAGQFLNERTQIQAAFFTWVLEIFTVS